MTQATAGRGRCVLILAVLAAVSVLLWPGSARAQMWLGAESGSLSSLHFTLPAGALPPGPATARVVRGQLQLDVDYAVRFDVAPGASHDVELAVSMLTAATQRESGVEVEVRSESGATWHTSVTPLIAQDWQGRAVFIGQAESMASFVSAVRAASPDPTVSDPITVGLQLQAGPASPERACRRIASARIIVVDGVQPDAARAWLDCVARGAKLVLVTEKPPPELSGLVAGDVWLWGAGRVAWAPAMAETAGRAALQVAGTDNNNFWLQGNLLSYGGYDAGTSPDENRLPVGLILVILALYVAAIGPTGWWMGIRPRRAWLAWGWFPAVAIVSTTVLAAATLAWRGHPALLRVERVVLLSPSGVGLASQSVRVEGSHAETYEIEFPWRDADLREASKPYRFGSPFGDPGGSVHVVEDQIRGQAIASGLSVGRYGQAAISWVEPARAPVPRLVRSVGGLQLVNDTPQRIVRAVVAVGEQWAELDAIPSGERRTVMLDQTRRTAVAQSTWVDYVISMASSYQGLKGVYVLATEVDAPSPVLTARPHVDLASREIRAVVGPLPKEDGAP